MALAALCGSSLVHDPAASQERSGDDSEDRPPVAVDEEIIVRGRSRAALRLRFRLAEEAVYERFNEINSDDEFDIFCYAEPVTGSRIPRRTCMPNFLREAQSQAGRETVRGLQGSSAVTPQHFQAEALHKRRLLAAELRRLATEDEDLRRALARVATLDQALAERTPSPAPTESTATRRAAEGEEALPYEASRVTDVRAGREPWSHALTQRTFTIAEVDGEVRAIEVDCAARTRRVEYEPGVEWTLPADWGACTLQVEAAPRTTFALYEFD